MAFENFNIQQPDIMGGFANAVDIAGAIKNQNLNDRKMSILEQQQRQEESKLSQEQQQLQQYQDALMELREDPSPRKSLDMAIRFPKESEAFKRISDMASEEQKKDSFNVWRDMNILLTKGDTEKAKMLLQSRYEAAVNSGNKEQASAIEGFVDVLDNDPKSLHSASYLMLNSSKEGQDYLKSLEEKETADSLQKGYRLDNNNQEFINSHQNEVHQQEMDAKRQEAELNRADSEYSRDYKRKQVEQIDADLLQKEKDRESSFEQKIFDIDETLSAINRARDLGNKSQYAGLANVYDAATGYFGSKWSQDEDVIDFNNQTDQIEGMFFLLKSGEIKGVVTEADKRDIKVSIANLRNNGSAAAKKRGLNLAYEIFERVRDRTERLHGIKVPSGNNDLISRDEDLNVTEQGASQVNREVEKARQAGGGQQPTGADLDDIVRHILGKR